MTDDRKQKLRVIFFVFVFLCLSSLVIGYGSARSANAQVNISTRTIVPNITLVWEARSYTPPFYKGKALMPDGGNGRIVAFVPSKTAPSKSTSYTWTVDGVVDGANSGVGKNTYEVVGDIFGGSPLIVVEVSDENGPVGTGVLRIPLAQPQVVTYADMPLGGVLFNAENPRTAATEIALEAYPLFFTTAKRSDPSMSYRWTVDGSSVSNPLGNSGRIVLRSETSVGTTTVGVSVANTGHMLENTLGKALIFLE